MQLKTLAAGTPSALPPIVLAHGLFGQARNLGALSRRLSDDRHVLAVDMRNHGDSFHDADHSYDALAADLARVIEGAGGPADVVGHSMGGKAAMRLALTRPDLVRRLVVLDIAPVAYGHTQMHLVEAMRSLDLSQIATRRQADQALAQRVDDAGVRAFLLQSLNLKTQPPRWDLNLDALGDQMAGLTGWPGHDGMRFDGPALFLAGADSDYVLPQHHDAIMAAFPAARIEHVADTGHWLHAERPDQVAEAVAAFLA